MPHPNNTTNTEVGAVGGDTASPVDFVRQASRQYPLLTALEEVELAKRIERGDAAAKEKMICSNLRLVLKMALPYQGRGMPLADLLQEGILGLIRATEKFDYRRGFKFSTYATWWIKQSIQRGLADRGRAIRLPVQIDGKARKVNAIERELLGSLARRPTDAEIAERAEDLPVTEVAELRRINSRTLLSLDAATRGSEDGSHTLLDSIEDDADVEHDAEDRLLADAVRDALEDLPEREREVIDLRFGLLPGRSPMALADVAEKLGVSRERVRQIESKTLRRLRANTQLEALAV